MAESFSQYAGQYIASVEEKIIASARTSLEAYKKAKKINATKMITLEYIPTKKETITFL